MTMIRGWRPAQPMPVRHRPWWLLLLLPGLLLLMRPTARDVHAYPMSPAAQPAIAQQEEEQLPDGVRPGVPGETRTLSVPTRRLMQGRMLLIDGEHPLPEGYAPRDTLALLATTHGQVTCRDASIVAGEDTLAALQELFAAAHEAHIVQLTVFAGARSREQQRALQVEAVADFSRSMALSEATMAAQAAVATPDCSEHQTPYAVDIRVCAKWNSLPEEAPLRASAAGRWLAENSWRYGFILRWPEAAPGFHDCRAYHLRYVGKAHAMLMHALDADFEEYLALLRQYGALTLYNEETPLAAAVCQLAGEHQTSFQLPEGTVEDLSLDNTGWAMASCLFTGASTP